ncbi:MULTISPECIES: putative DNA-binding protein [Bhargavaea]|uniref:UPF0122 protein ACFQQH_01100 n=1 Tax=Bhargavaea changchunensis TaxID=2134037 RepID=A0ABW2NCW1_9BACL|nr:putative DNA-binding protein [Bhargavaea sp. CC-171006]
MLLEKTTRMNFLFDFYQALLTEKQRSYMDLYYLNDLSLGEIAEQYDISRQAVYDNIRRTEAMLEEYEQKLQLFGKFRQRREAVDALVADVEQGGTDAGEIIRRLHELKEFD